MLERTVMRETFTFFARLLELVYGKDYIKTKKLSDRTVANKKDNTPDRTPLDFEEVEHIIGKEIN